MRNPFIVLRFVLLAFLLYLNILALGFAAWNINALKSAQLDVASAPSFALFNACCVFFYVTLSLVEAVYPSFWAPKTMLECVLTGAFSILQLASAVDVTINGPTVTCSSQSITSACASSSLLVALTWISSSTLFFYFLALVGVTVTHAGEYPAIWGASISSVSWFMGPQQCASVPQPLMSSKDLEGDPYENPVFKGDDLLSPIMLKSQTYQEREHSRISNIKGISISTPQSKSVESLRPSWAKVINGRRGIDPPFAASPKALPARLKSCWSTSTTFSAPPLPAKIHASPLRRNARLSSNGEYVVSVGSDMNLPVITPSPSRPISYGIFPDSVHDLDVPIETRHRSEWIPADHSRGSGGHTPAYAY